MSKTKLQLGFSAHHSTSVFNRELRRRKAEKVLAILEDHLGAIQGLEALDIGCSAGNNTAWYSKRLKHVTAIDVDTEAICYANKENRDRNISYGVMSGQQLGFRDCSFDVVICAHVYEHVPDANLLLQEIWRVLRPGGVCFFSAGNRLQLIEPHYRIPLLSVVPKSLAHIMVRLFSDGHTHYYETHLTCRGLKKLVARFDVSDYTMRVVADPERFHATDMVMPGSIKQRTSILALKLAYWLCPTYLWLLRKTADDRPTGFNRSMNPMLPSSRSERKRVLMIVRNFPPVTGGMERMLRNVHLQLCKSFDVILLGPSGCEQYASPTAAVVTVPRTPLWKFLIVVTVRAWHLAIKNRPDFVLSGGGLTAPASLISSIAVGAKSGCFVYGLDLVVKNSLYQNLFVPALRRHNLIFSISRNTTALAISRGINERRIRLLAPGVSPPKSDFVEPSRADFLRRISALPDEIILLSVGRLSPRKGLVEFVSEVMPHLSTAIPNIRLVVIGAEPTHAIGHAPGQKDRLNSAIRNAGLEKKITVLGEVDDATLRSAYVAARLLVFPILDLPGDVEGFGMVAVEAAAHGLPTVAFSVGGVPDAVADGLSGYLVPPGDYRQFIDKIIKHVTVEDREAWRKKCLRHAAQFSWDAYGERLNHMIENAIPTSRTDDPKGPKL